ncbi:MAG: NADH-quinone oxidoreductase subunit N [Candidatus Dormibacteraeota bacterium]|nr:NADH-quinone oxidoreductase subunit N [Candidatus Dormibacteraeota bacterium]
MTPDNVLAFAPELWLLAGAIVVFAVARFRPGFWATAIALSAVVLAFLALLTQAKQTITILDGAFLLDGYAVVIDMAILVASALALLISLGDVIPDESRGGELAGFMLLATVGAMLSASAAEMVALLVSLELLAVNLYLLAALARRGGDAAHAGVGYLVLGMAGTAILVYGLALIYGLTGETRLAAAGRAMRTIGAGQPAALLALTLLIVGFLGKLGMTPVRWWTRAFDLGVPMRVLAFVSSVGVLAGFAAFTRVLWSTFSSTSIGYSTVIAVVAAIAMTGGAVLALAQTSVRRLLVYSTVAQGGYALAAMVDLPRNGVRAMLVFVIALGLTNLCAFAAMMGFARAVHSDAIRDLAGMARSTPGVAVVLGLAIASLIGLPPLAGFFAKFVALKAVVDGGFTWLAVVGVFDILLLALCYLRLVRVAFLDPPVYEVPPHRLDWPLRLAMGVSTAGVIFLGLGLGPLLTAASYGQHALVH